MQEQGDDNGPVVTLALAVPEQRSLAQLPDVLKPYSPEV